VEYSRLKRRVRREVVQRVNGEQIATTINRKKLSYKLLLARALKTLKKLHK